MKTLRICVKVGLSVILVGCADPTSVQTQPQLMTKTVSSSKLEDCVFEEVNRHRASIGKGSVKKHRGLELLAKQHAVQLAKVRFAAESGSKIDYHQGFDTRSDIARNLYGLEAIGENVAKSSNPDSKRFVRLWSESGEHRWTLNSDWTYTGIGTASGPDGSVIVTQIFGTH